MKKFFTLALLLASVCVYAQPYATGKRSLNFIDGQRSDRPVPVDIYYPATTAGTDVDIVAGTNKFPVVVFAHGFLISSSSYKWLADSLVKTGYIVVFPNTEDGILPSHLDFGLDLNFLASRITSLNDSSASFLYQRVIKKVALGGHSMGGGATFLAAALQNNVVKAIFNFAAAETTPSATTAALLDVKPTLIIGGSGDCVVKDSVQNAMYDGILLGCKTYVNFTDYWHCQFANNNAICAAGQLVAGCGFFPPVNTQTVLTNTFSLVSPFLDFYLQDICGRGDAFINTYNTLPDVANKRRSCFFLPSCGPLPVKLTTFNGKTENNKNILFWATASEENTSYFELEKSGNGRQFNNLAKIDVKPNNAAGKSYTHSDGYPFSGDNFYRLKIVDRNGYTAYSDIVKIKNSIKPLTVTQLFPNPVSNQLTMQLQAEKQQAVLYSFFDVTGKLILSQHGKMNAGSNAVNISLANLSQGTYILQVQTIEGVIAGTFKIFKM